MSRITDRYIPCVYSSLSNIKIRDREPRLNNSLHQADIRKKILGGAGGLSLTQNQREAHMFHLVREEEVLFAEKKFTLS